MSARPVRHLPPALAAVLDLVAVLVFAAAGKSSHAEHGGALEVLTIAWPFAVGAAMGWTAYGVLQRAAPLSARSGLWMAVSSVVVGQLVRVATGRGTAAAFVVVSAVVLVALMVGWRLLARIGQGGGVELSPEG